MFTVAQLLRVEAEVRGYVEEADVLSRTAVLPVSVLVQNVQVVLDRTCEILNVHGVKGVVQIITEACEPEFKIYWEGRW